jgi:hypothetical protein
VALVSPPLVPRVPTSTGLRGEGRGAAVGRLAKNLGRLAENLGRLAHSTEMLGDRVFCVKGTSFGYTQSHVFT